MASPLAAANAYASLARLAPTGGAGAGAGVGLGAAVGGGADKGFGAMLKDAIGSVVETGRKSDSQTAAMMTGKADMVDVVTAVSQTEVAVEALVSVRDKVIQAYEEIMRMPI